MQRLAVVFCAVALVQLVAAQDRPLPDAAAFIARVKTHLASDEERQSGYTYIERATQTKVDGKGRVTDTSVKVFEVYPGLPGERPLSPADRGRRPAGAARQAGERGSVAAKGRRGVRQNGVDARPAAISKRGSRKRIVANCRPQSTISFASTTSAWSDGNRSTAAMPSS